MSRKDSCDSSHIFPAKWNKVSGIFEINAYTVFGLSGHLDRFPILPELWNLPMWILKYDEGTLRQGSEPTNGFSFPALARSSEISLPSMWLWPGTQDSVLSLANSWTFSLYSGTKGEYSLWAPIALIALWLSEKINIDWSVVLIASNSLQHCEIPKVSDWNMV